MASHSFTVAGWVQACIARVGNVTLICLINHGLLERHTANTLHCGRAAKDSGNTVGSKLKD